MIKRQLELWIPVRTTVSTFTKILEEDERIQCLLNMNKCPIMLTREIPDGSQLLTLGVGFDPTKPHGFIKEFTRTDDGYIVSIEVRDNYEQLYTALERESNKLVVWPALLVGGDDHFKIIKFYLYDLERLKQLTLGCVWRDGPRPYDGNEVERILDKYGMFKEEDNDPDKILKEYIPTEESIKEFTDNNKEEN